MRPVRPLLAAFALLAALVPWPAADAGMQRALTIVGSRNSFAVLTVKERTTYRLDTSITAVWAGGRWAGFAIGTDWPHVWSVYERGGKTFQGVPTHTASRYDELGVLYPGTYRVYLFADGQDVTIRIPWSGPDVTLEPDAPVDARFAAEVVPFSGGGQLALPQDGAAGTITSSLVRWELLQSRPGSSLRACFAAPPASWATCDRRLPAYKDAHYQDVSNRGLWGGAAHPLVTRGRSLFAEVTGPATGTLSAITLRYRPHPDDRIPARHGRH